jgi:hypothetical protein
MKVSDSKIPLESSPPQHSDEGLGFNRAPNWRMLKPERPEAGEY